MIHHYLTFPALNVQMIHSHFLSKAIISIYSKPIKTFACGASKKTNKGLCCNDQEQTIENWSFVLFLLPLLQSNKKSFNQMQILLLSIVFIVLWCHWNKWKDRSLLIILLRTIVDYFCNLKTILVDLRSRNTNFISHMISLTKMLVIIQIPFEN